MPNNQQNRQQQNLKNQQQMEIAKQTGTIKTQSEMQKQQMKNQEQQQNRLQQNQENQQQFEFAKGLNQRNNTK